MIKIGMMIGERYEILEKIGTGGMSDVYKAKDHKLNRFVAVKILKQEFSENSNFVSKFRIEAQAAAGLMHPNIVNVYDVGEEQGIYYIVMELVEGITLKKYIEKKARLSYKEAVSIAIQVCMGIEAAHSHHIIHRDIKPQNIIISKDGKVKVTDFGIAKAATSNTITSNVMGSVHYTSPEQARGGYSDEKSDIYSLGVTMFEMLTGRVPFNGETTVAIAIKHIQEEMPSPAEYVPEIPSSVESIVLKCCQKSPNRRYQSIQELIADLKQSLMSPDEDFVVQTDPDMESGTRTITEGDMAQIKRRAAYQEYEEPEHMRLRSDTAPLYQSYDGDEEDDDYDYNPKMERVTTILAVTAGIVICVILIVLAVRIFGGGAKGSVSGGDESPILTDSPSPSPAYTVMPPLVGETREEARKALLELGLEAQEEYRESEDSQKGVVLETLLDGETVKPGRQIEAGSTVTLVVGLGKEGVKVPDVTGSTAEEAVILLKHSGFTVTKMEGYSDTVAAGVVVSQMPQGGAFATAGANITITVSMGKEEDKIRVPNLLGQQEMDGIVELREHGLSEGQVSYEYNDTYPAGQICYQSTSAGSWVEAGKAIDLTVSQGPAPATNTPAPAATYRFNKSIEAPTPEEAPEYKAGMSAKVQIVAEDGTELTNTTVSGFPMSVNFSGLKSPGGTLTITFTVQEPVTTADPEGGQTATGETQTRDVVVTRKLTFEKEN